MASRRVLRGLGGLLSLAASLSFSVLAGAADAGFYAVPLLPPPSPPENIGIPCSIGAPPFQPFFITAQTLPWPSVWLGHFAGGRPDPVFYGQIDWRDEKVCFATKATCQAWIKEMRYAFHRPEGYWTCVLLR